MTVSRSTRISIDKDRWHINGQPTYPNARAEGLLMNVRMANAVFEDARLPYLDPERNTDLFIAYIADYVAHGIRAFTISLQGGFPGYEDAVNTAFRSDGSLKPHYMERVKRVVEACDKHGAAVILSCFYQRQECRLADEQAVRNGLSQVVYWIKNHGFTNIILEIANEYSHPGYTFPIFKEPAGQIALIRQVKQQAPELITAACKHDKHDRSHIPDEVAEASDLILTHFNKTPLHEFAERIRHMRQFGKPVLINEDLKTDQDGAEAAEACVRHGASWGLMTRYVNQLFPFRFEGHRDDPVVYSKLKELTSP